MGDIAELGFKQTAFRWRFCTRKKVNFTFQEEAFDVKIIKYDDKFILTVREAIANNTATAVGLQSMAERFNDQAVEVVHATAKYDKKGFITAVFCVKLVPLKRTTPL